MNTPNKERMLELITLLNDACQYYYDASDIEPLMTDAEYDRTLAELTRLEEETGYVLSNSPNASVGFPDSSDGIVRHIIPILSLKDTKSTDDISTFLGDRDGVLSWKLDGMSVVLRYEFGKLQQALSRGDGKYGKDITKNVVMMRDVPLRIDIMNPVIIRGEGCISNVDFMKIKKMPGGGDYSNPRNMIAGLLNSTRTTNPFLKYGSFIVHTAMALSGTGCDLPTRADQLLCLKNLGFKVVKHIRVNSKSLMHEINKFSEQANSFEYPVDGLVVSLNDVKYGESLGSTAKFPRHSMALKWPDEQVLTKVTGMKWSVSRTGLITPVVTFTPVELEGTTVKQANLHSLRFFKNLAIGVGDNIIVFKANKIVPEVAENLTMSNTAEIPLKCPVCGGKTYVIKTGQTEKLYCQDCTERSNIV